LLCWALWCAAGLDLHPDSWAALARTLGEVRAQDFLPPAVGRAFVRHLVLLAVAGAIAAGQLGAGWTALGLVRLPGARGWERAAVAVLAGFAVTGTLGFALALTGLFHAPLIVLGAAAGLACPGLRSGLKGLAAARPGRPPWWALLALVPFFAGLLRALAPDPCVDALTYHLAVPELWLQGHRYAAEGTSFAHQFPSLAECVYAPAVVWRFEALPPWLNLAPFLGAVALLAGRAAAAGGAAAGWLAAALVLAFGMTGYHLALAKNDLAAAAYPVAGLALLLRGPRGGWIAASGLLFGAGAAVKFNGGLLAAVGALGVAASPRTRRSFAAWMALAALAPVPWLVRNWIMFGDPVWPALSAVIPGALWDEESVRAVAAMRHGVPLQEVPGRILRAFPGALMEFSPVIALAFPAVIIGWRRPGVAALAGFGFAGAAACYAAMPAEWHRLALPCFVAWAAATAVILAPAVARAKGLAGAAVLAAGAVAGWWPAPMTSLGGLDAPAIAGWIAGKVDRGSFLDRRLTTLRDLDAALAARPGVRSVVTVAEIRTYGMPGRPLVERCWGRTFPWVLAGECRTAAGIRRRLRQMNASHLAYNFMIEAYPHPWAALFYWDDRRLAVWKDFAERWLAIVAAPARVDEANGGFYVYEILARPVPKPVRPLPFLPGIQSLIFAVTGCADDAAGGAAALALARRLPDVLNVLNLAGTSRARLGDWAGAYRFLEPGVRAGVVDADNFYLMGRAALRLGRPEEARRCLLRAREVMPGLGRSIDILMESAREGGRAKR